MRSSFASLLLFILPAVLASTCPSTNIPQPDPGKCWSCDKNSDFSNPNQGNVVESWTDFYCEYEKKDPGSLSDPNRQDDYPYIKVLCTYNGSGDLIKRLPDSQPCPSKAIPQSSPCEAPKRPTPHGSTPFEDCCGTGCKKETDRCFYCPQVSATWVDVDASGKDLVCTYHVESDTHDQTHSCTFDGTTGKYDGNGGYCIPGSVAPQRAECLQQHPDYKVGGTVKATCPDGPDKQDCEQKNYTRCDHSCQSNQSYCSDICATDDCWTCPVIAGTTLAQATGLAGPQFHCTYYKDGADSPVSAGYTCLYKSSSGTLDGGSGCPGTAGVNDKCKRSKPAS